MNIEEFPGCCGAQIAYELGSDEETFSEIQDSVSSFREAVFIIIPIAPPPEFDRLKDAYPHRYRLYETIAQKHKPLYTWINPNTGATLALILLKEADPYGSDQEE